MGPVPERSLDADGKDLKLSRADDLRIGEAVTGQGLDDGRTQLPPADGDVPVPVDDPDPRPPDQVQVSASFHSHMATGSESK